MSGKKGKGGNKKLNILIRAEIDKDQFKQDIDSQIKGLQKVLDGKSLKIDVNLGDTKKLQQTTDNIGKSLSTGLKSSKDEMDKMAKTMEKLNKEMDEVNNNRADAIKRAKNDWQSAQKDTVWGKMKEVGVRRPKKGEQYYEEFRQLPESVRKNKNYWKPASQTRYSQVDGFLQEAKLGKGMTPSKMFDVLGKGTPKFDASKDMDKDTLKGIELGEKRVKEIRDEVARLTKDYSAMGKVVDSQTNDIKQQTSEIQKQEKAVDSLASKWKKVSVATTSVGEGTEKTPSSRVTNEKDQDGNRKVKRETFDAETKSWMHDSETYIANLKEVETAKQKYGLKHGKWADRIAEVNTKAFKMNGHGLKDIEKLTGELTKIDATSDKIEFQKFDNELKKLEKQMKDNLKQFDDFEKKKNSLKDTGKKLSNDGVISEKQLGEVNKHVNKADAFSDDGKARLKQVEDEMKKKEQMVKAERESAEIKKTLDEKSAKDEQKRLKDREAVLKEEQNIRKKVSAKEASEQAKKDKDREAVLKEEQNIRKKISDKEAKQLASETKKSADDREAVLKEEQNIRRKIANKEKSDNDAKSKQNEAILNEEMAIRKRVADNQAKRQKKEESDREKSLKYEQTVRKAIDTKTQSGQKKQEKQREQALQAEHRMRRALSDKEAKLESDKTKARDKIKDYESKGLLNSSRANNYQNSVNKAVTSEDLAKVDKYFKSLDKIIAKEKQRTQQLGETMRVNAKLSSQDEQQTQAMIKQKEKLRKKLQQIASTDTSTGDKGREFESSLNGMSRTLDTSHSVDELNKLERKISNIIEGNRNLAIINQRRAREENTSTIGSIRNFTRLNQVTDEHIRDVLRNNEAYRDRRVIATSVNRATGEWSATIRQSGRQERIVRGEIDRTTGAIRQQGDVMRDTSSRNLGFLEQFRIALTRVPVWAGAMTVIYGTQHALQEMISTIVEVDTAMTELKRVMDADTNFDDMLSSSIEMSKELGNNLAEVNKAIIGFARQGFGAEESLAMAKTAIVASNVSELTADEAMENLTAIMVQFNIEADKSISIVDKLNEVDNNFAITTKNLADATAKGGATAQTFGVTLEEMIGHVTAIGVATRESGTIVGNSLKTIYSRITTMDGAVDILDSVGVSTKGLDGEMRSVSDILEDLHGKWDGLSKSQQQNIGVTIAGRNQLSRFLAFMNNFEMGLDATKTALNSQGSAMRENEKFLASMQAKINTLKVAFSEMALALGEAFLGATFIGIVTLLTKMAESATFLAKSGATLPILFGLISTALLILSPAMRGFAVALFDIPMYATRAGVALLSLRGAVTSLTLAWRSLLASTGLGLLFVALGYGIEKLIGHFQDARKEEALVEEQQNKIADSYTNHKDRIMELIEQYEKMEGITGRTAQQEAEFNSVTEELAGLLPNVVKSIDEKGKAHLKSAEAIKSELGYAKELAGLKLEEKVLNAEDNFDKQLKERKEALKEIKDIQKAIDEAKSGKTKKDLESQSIRSGNSLGLANFDEEEEINKLEIKMKGLQATVARLSGEIKTDFEEVSKGIMTLDGANFDEIGKQFEKLMKSINPKILSSMGTDELTSFANQFANAITDMQKAQDSMSIDGLTNAEMSLRAILDQMGISEEKIEMFIRSMYGATDATVEFDRGVVESISNMDAINTKFQETAEEVSVYNELLERMAEGKALTANEAINMIAKEEELAQAISFENGMVKVNVKAVKSMRDDKISVFNDIIKARRVELQAQADALIVKLNNYGVEVKAIMSVADAQNALAKATEKRNAEIKKIDEYNGPGAMHASDVVTKTYDAVFTDINAIKKQLTFLDSLEAMTKKGLKEIGTAKESYVEPKKEKKEKEDKKEEPSQYVSDQYKKDLDAVNDKIQKQIDLREKLTVGSKAYRNSVRAESKETLNKIAIMEKEAKSLEAQIKAKKLFETGVVNGETKTETLKTVKLGNSVSEYKNMKTTKQIPLTAKDVNKAIDRALKAGGYKNSKMKNQGQAFVDASKASGLNALYLMAHAAHETGWGTSNISKKKNNFYGISAFDASPMASSYNYDNTKAGIVEGAKWIAKNYANGKSKQNTLQKMRFNGGKHQYATDPKWADKIAGIMKSAESSIGTTVKGVVTVGGDNKDQSKKQEALDKAREELKKLKTDIKAEQAKLDEYQVLIIDSNVEEYESRISKYDKDIEKSVAVMWKYDSASKNYLKELNKQKTAITGKQKQNKDEVKYLESTIKNSKKLGLSSKYLKELKEQLASAKLAGEEFKQSLADKELEIVNRSLDIYSTKMEKLDRALQLLNSQQGLMNEGSEKEIVMRRKQVEALRELQKEAVRELNYTNKQLKNDKLSVQAKKDLAKSVEELTKEIVDYDNSIQDTNDSLRDTALAGLEAQKQLQTDEMTKALDKEIEKREALIKTEEDRHDALIKAKQDEIDLSEEQIELDERQKALNEINDEISKTKKDKRFSYITAQGEEILTYNKGQVSELEKQRNEMLEQYNRDDIRKARQEELETLQKNKEDAIKIMQDELEAYTKVQNEKIKENQEHWDAIIKAVEEGAITSNNLMKTWYGKNLEALKAYGVEVEVEANKIKKALEQMSLIDGGKTPTTSTDVQGSRYDPSKDTASSYGGKGKVQIMGNNGKLQDFTFKTTAEIDKKLNSGYVINKYHEGGQVAGKVGNRLSEIANNMFNAKADEQVILALKGEIMTPEKNIASKFIPNIKKLVGSIIGNRNEELPTVVSQKHYHFKDITIKSENVNKFLDSIDFLVKSEGK